MDEDEETQMLAYMTLHEKDSVEVKQIKKIFDETVFPMRTSYSKLPPCFLGRAQTNAAFSAFRKLEQYCCNWDAIK